MPGTAVLLSPQVDIPLRPSGFHFTSHALAGVDPV